MVDISGDGKDYEVEALKAARAALIAAGVTINGLPILSSPDDPDVADYYRDRIIGGPGAFISPARDFEAIGSALRRKLVLELT